MSKDPSAIYTQEWFTQFPPLRAEFRAFGEALDEVFRPRIVADIGCGPGMVIERMKELGCIVGGYEGSTHGIACASDAIRPYISHVDIVTIHPCDMLRSDLVICTEVAEHLEGSAADHLVALLAASTRDRGVIYFTAAPPGQGGHDHVNEQPMGYWLEKFERQGFHACGLEQEVHQHMRAKIAEWAQTWLFTNAVVLAR